ncbi:MAG: UDP-N-acetylmuramoyl-L-alanyl-D-glutamate--2,6-diaminopimelate ligase [Oscillospiraceae bacterium]|jgi:UDP-N-acetylmuramoyl-L-alanyl-D-glutamate--2,6-diaminopimelate ligase|nr:UDP-N-acetylmuramoyl-L-alanyl-D-glutamate--2,6-diaminopimelate ligase [Oscillospiraceae bacterium]
MRLRALATVLGITTGLPEIEITDIAYDSRRVRPGALFVCVPGESVDGHDWAQKAYDNGARVFVAQRSLSLPDNALVLPTDNPRLALARLSAAFFAYPASEMTLIGVTGTKGKTTITYLLRSVLEAAGHTVGIIGTAGVEYAGVREKTVNTTPESYELHRIFRAMRTADVTVCVMEVSSLGLKQHRTDGLRFDVGIFTNVSPDHIGQGGHEDMAEYIGWKARLFAQSRVSIINTDDPCAADMFQTAGERITYALQDKSADIRGGNIQKWQSATALGIAFDVHSAQGNDTLRLPQPGDFSAYNALAVVAAAQALGIPREATKQGLAAAVVPGRAQILPARPDITVLLDYAHNALSLESILRSVRAYDPARRIVCLFGSVGGRDQQRRAGLGKVASALADFCVLTADNPDFEDPQAIIDEIRAAFVRDCPFVAYPDRREAIRWALQNAHAGDIILLCGKGHETTQRIRGVDEPFSEAEIVQEIMEK